MQHRTDRRARSPMVRRNREREELHKSASLVGKIQNTGLVEMSLGTPLKTSSTTSAREAWPVARRAVQPAALQAAAFRGNVRHARRLRGPRADRLHHGLGRHGAVFDEDNCMVDVARYFFEFTHSESCGKCVPCRVGLNKALRILIGLPRARERPSTWHCSTNSAAHGPRVFSLRAWPVGAQPRPHHNSPLPRRVRRPHRRASLPCGRLEELALSPCENSCPLRMNIPRFLELRQEGRLEDAFESVVLDNPLPSSTGRVCQHPCDNRCRRQGFDESVNMREVHRFIADIYFHSDRFARWSHRMKRRSCDPTAQGRCCGRGTHRPYCSVLSRHARPRCDDLRRQARSRRHVALRHSGIPVAEIRAGRELDLIEAMGVKFVFNIALASTSR